MPRRSQKKSKTIGSDVHGVQNRLGYAARRAYVGSKLHGVGYTSVGERLWRLGLADFSGLAKGGVWGGGTYGGMEWEVSRRGQLELSIGCSVGIVRLVIVELNFKF